MAISDRELIHNLALAKARLARAKKEELRWRLLVALTLFPNAELGTNLYNDGEVKLVCKETFTLSTDQAQIASLMQHLWESYPEERDTLKLLLGTKYVLVKDAYDCLSEEAQNAFAEVLTIKPALATVTLKGEKK